MPTISALAIGGLKTKWPLPCCVELMETSQSEDSLSLVMIRDPPKMCLYFEHIPRAL